MEVGISEVRSIRDGGVVIKCKTKEEIEKVKSEAEKNLGRQYNVTIPLQKNPCIKVVGIQETMDEDSLISSIQNQNNYLKHPDFNVKVVVFKKMMTRYMAILECDPISHSKILSAKSLCIGWTAACRVYDYVRIFRCFKCGGYNHKADECKSEVICLRCGSKDHAKKDCDSEVVICTNCVEASKSLKLDLDIHHSMFDSDKCVVYQKKAEIERQKFKHII